MKHRHHIIPKHMGGSNEPSNLMEVSVEEHANLHLDLYLTHGHREDWIAYHVLSGQMKQEELLLERSRLGARHPNVRSVEANLKRSKTLTGSTHSLTHIQNKVKSAKAQRAITDEEFVEVKRLRSEGKTLEEIANVFNTSAATIHRYLKNKVKGVM